MLKSQLAALGLCLSYGRLLFHMIVLMVVVQQPLAVLDQRSCASCTYVKLPKLLCCTGA